MGCFESKGERRDPVAVRGCTDVCWLIIFILFWVVLVSFRQIRVPLSVMIKINEQRLLFACCFFITHLILMRIPVGMVLSA
jgi:hypothetical protein